MSSIKIVGTGSYLPEKVLSNYDLEEMVDTTDEWIIKRTGIRERRMAAPDEAASDISLIASNRALEMAGMKPEDLDMVILCTLTPDMACPSGANFLEKKLKATNAVSFDVTAACSGFIFGLTVAYQFLMNGVYRNALIVGAEILTRMVDYTYRGRGAAVLWGDGAGAAIIAVDDDSNAPGRVLSVHIDSDARDGDKILVPSGGSITTPITEESAREGRHCIYLKDANRSLKAAVEKFCLGINLAVEHNNITLDDVSLIIPHQANIRIVQAMAKRLKLPMEKIFVNIEKYGNMSSATVPVGLDEALRGGSIKAGDYVILVAFGGGYVWASALVKW